MIFDQLSNCRLYYGLNERIQRAFNFILYTDLLSLKPGKYYIEDTEIYASVSDYETKPAHSARYEAHRKYIDVQYLAKGTEMISCSDIGIMKQKTLYDEEKDICYYEGEADAEIKLRPGTFALFMPHDVHKPSVMIGDIAEPVRKIVLKIRA